MFKKQKNKLKMYRAVRDICNAHTMSWNGVPAFVSAFTAFSEKVTLLSELGTTQSTIAKGVRDQREVLFNDTLDLAVRCARALRSFALNADDIQTANAVRIYKSDILAVSQVEALQLVTFISKLAEEHASGLEDYGITPETITLLSSKRDELKAEVNSPRIAIIERKTVTGKIVKLIDEIDTLLEEQMDSVTDIIRPDEPDFFAVYTNARLVVNSGTRHKSAEEPSEGETGKPDDVGGLF